MNRKTTILSALFLILMSGTLYADNVILDDQIVGESLCVGQDCVNGESFGFDTIRVKENNTRIRFLDTSSSASFPTSDWELVANDSSNGGQNRFSIEDEDQGTVPFSVIRGNVDHALYVAPNGVGLGTNTPARALHITDSNTPSFRLEQNGAGGFAPQTWDIGSNESNFFVRDATNGGQLPFRVQSGAPSNSSVISGMGDIGFGTSTPASSVHIARDGASLLV